MAVLLQFELCPQVLFQQISIFLVLNGMKWEVYPGVFMKWTVSCLIFLGRPRGRGISGNSVSTCAEAEFAGATALTLGWFDVAVEPMVERLIMPSIKRLVWQPGSKWQCARKSEPTIVVLNIGNVESPDKLPTVLEVVRHSDGAEFIVGGFPSMWSSTSGSINPIWYQSKTFFGYLIGYEKMATGKLCVVEVSCRRY